MTPVHNHGFQDVSSSQDDGERAFVGRCRCSWASDPCANAVHAQALVEDHIEHARAARGRSVRARQAS
jgi:hypothetical protein